MLRIYGISVERMRTILAAAILAIVYHCQAWDTFVLTVLPVSCIVLDAGHRLRPIEIQSYFGLGKDDWAGWYLPLDGT